MVIKYLQAALTGTVYCKIKYTKLCGDNVNVVIGGQKAAHSKWRLTLLNISSSVPETSAARAENRTAAFISHFVTFLHFSGACLLFKHICVLNHLDFKVCIFVSVSCVSVSLSDNKAWERAVFCTELPSCLIVSPSLVPALVQALREQPVLPEAVQSWGLRLGVHVGVFSNSLHESGGAVTSGRFVLCILQTCICPKTDRSAQIPGFTDHRAQHRHSGVKPLPK